MTQVSSRLPAYDELPVKEGAPPGSAWGLFGDDDQVGLVNLMTPEKAVEAARLVRRGATFALNWEFEQPAPPLYRRGALRHTILGQGFGRDDVIDNFYPQASSQWDGLTHVGHPDHGFYNGVQEADITGREGTKNGIEHWARRGMVTRGVLLDVARYAAANGNPIDGAELTRFPVSLLEATRRAQGVEIRTGDILLIRSGWMAWYQQAPPAERMRITHVPNLKTPGIAAGKDMAAYLWNLHIAAIASDAPALEAWPPDFEGDGFLHRILIGLFGMAIGELWNLEDLAADCAADGVYEFMFTSAPLNIRGGVGSPPNALAIK
jgi:kynurenine formamidase